MKDCFDLCSLNCGVETCCDTAHSDLYPPTNLISPTSNHKGFMAEYYIKPPISLYLHLPFPVILVELSAETSIENQSSLLFALTGSSTDPGKCSEKCNKSLRKRRKTNSTDQSKHEYNKKYNAGEVIDLTEPIDEDYTNLGKGIAVEGKIVFTNYQDRPEGSGHVIKDTSRPSVRGNLRVLRIQILRTHQSSVPCLKNLQLWVKPKTEEDRNYLASLQSEKASVTSSLTFFGCPTDEFVPSLQVGEAATTKEKTIPSEFLDEITQEIMIIPMVLPSGKLVDRSTVDKCNREQSIYGGLPRDPFSGVVYRTGIKPVFNGSLKSRIDAYLLENNITAAGGRSLGDSAAIQSFIQRRHQAETGRKRSFPAS